MPDPSDDRPRPPSLLPGAAVAGGFLSGIGVAGGVVAMVVGGLATALGVTVMGWGEALQNDYYGFAIGLLLTGGGAVVGLVGVVLLVVGAVIVGVVSGATGLGVWLARRFRRGN